MQPVESAADWTAPEQAFRALQQAVVSLHARGKRTYIQGVKPEVQRRNDGFDERALGYESFGALVRAAERAGWVTTRRVDGQVELAVPDADGLAAVPSRAPARVRKDMWDALVNWDPERRHFYDRETGAVLPADQLEGAVPEQAPTGAIPAPARYVELPGLTQEEQRAWATEFVDAHANHRLAPFLKDALQRPEEPLKAFFRLVRFDPALHSRWKEERRMRVGERAAAWADEHDLNVDLWGSKPAAITTPPMYQGHADAAPSETALYRQAIHQAVDRMPLQELLALRIPIGYLRDTGL